MSEPGLPQAACEDNQRLVRRAKDGERACHDDLIPIAILDPAECRFCDGTDSEGEPWCPVCSYCCGC